jgi:hypothetical protein
VSIFNHFYYFFYLLLTSYLFWSSFFGSPFYCIGNVFKCTSLHSYEPVTLKSLQTKITEAEAQAERLLMPGAHSNGPAEDGKNLPAWVDVFQKYFELKKSSISKSAWQEQFRTALQTMRNTLIPPAEALDTRTSSVTWDGATVEAHTTHPASKSLIASDGTITLVPAVISNSQTSSSRNVHHRVGNAGSTGAGLGITGTGIDRFLEMMMMMMNNHTRQLLRRPFQEVHGDYKEAKENLVASIAANDHGDISFYCAALNALEDELKSHQ